jgi:hypothetical protein
LRQTVTTRRPAACSKSRPTRSNTWTACARCASATCRSRQTFLTARFEQALRIAARTEGRKLPIPVVSAAQGLHALIDGLIEDWLLDPAAFDLVLTGRRVFHVYLSGLGFQRKGESANDAADSPIQPSA